MTTYFLASGTLLRAFKYCLNFYYSGVNGQYLTIPASYFEHYLQEHGDYTNYMIEVIVTDTRGDKGRASTLLYVNKTPYGGSCKYVSWLHYKLPRGLRPRLRCTEYMSEAAV